MPVGRESRLYAAQSDGAHSRASRHRAEPVLAITHDRNIAVAVCTAYRHAESAEFCQQQRRRVAVVVVQPDGDDGELGMYGRQEPSVGVCAAVMGHLEHVRADVDACRQHGLLLLDLGVTGQEHPHTVHGRAYNHRRVVGVGPRPVQRDPWREHVETYLSGVDTAAHDGRAHRQSVISEDVANHLDPGRRLSKRTGQHLPDLPTVEHARDAAHVVQVVVAEQQQRDLVHV